LHELGPGWSPWPPEAKEGNIWPMAIQLLNSMLQDECVEMDTSGDFFVGIEEAIPAYEAGLIGPLTDQYQTAWYEMKRAASYWNEGWATADLESLWRDGEIGIRYTGAWEFSQQRNDPFIEFERGMIPPPYVGAADVEYGNDPPEFTPGDGKVPGELVVSINGPDTAIMKVAQDRGHLEGAVKYLQFATEPENCGFLVNEQEQGIPAAKDAPLGPLFTEIASFVVPKLKYQISWWGEALYVDNTHFNEIRKIFVAWATDQIDDETFFQRQHDETVDAIARYKEALEDLKESEG
jgi:hypothetical protein